jgi:hypothetical protein
MQKQSGIRFQGTPLPGVIWRIKNDAYLSNDMLGLGALLKLFIRAAYGLLEAFLKRG